jgi:hypothetical protein
LVRVCLEYLFIRGDKPDSAGVQRNGSKKKGPAVKQSPDFSARRGLRLLRAWREGKKVSEATSLHITERRILVRLERIKSVETDSSSKATAAIIFGEP